MGESGKAEIATKRAYEAPSGSDGTRILVDRIWPRGVAKDALKLDCWMKELAPSDSLRRWFHHDQGRWDEFRQRYFEELAKQPELVERLLSKCGRTRVTLVFAAKDTLRNNAVALKDYLERYALPRE